MRSINLSVKDTQIQEPKQELTLLLKEVLVDSDLLSQKEKEILFYSIVEQKTLSEIGKDYSLSAERVRQVRNTSLQKIRDVV